MKLHWVIRVIDYVVKVWGEISKFVMQAYSDIETMMKRLCLVLFHIFLLLSDLFKQAQIMLVKLEDWIAITEWNIWWSNLIDAHTFSTLIGRH